MEDKQIVDLYKMMHRLGGPKGLIRQSEFFVYTKKDREAVERCMDLGYEFPEITTWIRAKKEDFNLVSNLGIKETGILVSCSDYHIFKKLKMIEFVICIATLTVLIIGFIKNKLQIEDERTKAEKNLFYNSCVKYLIGTILISFLLLS